MKTDSKLLTITKLAEYIGIPKRTLYDMITDGRFDVAPQRGSDPRKWHVDNVDAWMKQQ